MITKIIVSAVVLNNAVAIKPSNVNLLQLEPTDLKLESLAEIYKDKQPKS